MFSLVQEERDCQEEDEEEGEEEEEMMVVVVVGRFGCKGGYSECFTMNQYDKKNGLRLRTKQRTDGPVDRQTDQPTNGHTLLQRCKDASKNDSGWLGTDKVDFERSGYGWTVGRSEMTENDIFDNARVGYTG